MKRFVYPLFFLSLLLNPWVTGCQGQSKNPAHPEHNSLLQKQAPQKEVWTCPMHPQIHKDGPGQCPICGMSLVKVDIHPELPSGAGSGIIPDAHAPIALSAERQQMIGVKFSVAEKKPLFKSIRAAGRLAFDPELYTAQNEYAEALRQLDRVKDSPLPDVNHSAKRMVGSAQLRLKILGLSDQQIAQIKSADFSESNLLINKPGQPVWVYADIYEMDISNVRPGQSAEITAGFLGGITLPGKVASVDRVINPNTRTAKARILVQQAATLLRPESYVDVTILAPLGEQVTVPFDAVLDTGKQSWIFIAGENGQFMPRVVSIRFHAGDDVAIGSGLSGGEKIVSSANFLIDSESRLKAATLGPAPTCPNEQHWDIPMAMCMPN